MWAETRTRKMAAVLDGGERSGVSQAAFARRRGIPAGALTRWWLALRRPRQLRGPCSAGLVEVTIPAAAMKPELAASLEVIVPPGS